MAEKVKRKRPFLVLFIITAVLLVAAVLFSLFLLVNLQAKSRALDKFHIPYAFNARLLRQEITFEPEQASYSKDTDKITFKITDPTGLGFSLESYYYVEKSTDLDILSIWPTHTFLGSEHDLIVYTFGPSAEPSENGEPVSADFTIDLSDWKVRPVSGTYTLYAIIHIPLGSGDADTGQGLFLISGSFTIK